MSSLVTFLTLADAMAVALDEARPLTERIAALRETRELSALRSDFTDAVARGYLDAGYLPPASCADGAVQSHCDPTPLIKAACLLSCLIEHAQATYRAERLVERLTSTHR